MIGSKMDWDDFTQIWKVARAGFVSPVIWRKVTGS